MPQVAEALGYAASLAVSCTFYMKTMVRLRYVAIGSNVLFIAYGAAGRLYPVLLLHAVLLPLNLVRLVEVRRLSARVREASRGELSLEPLIPYMQRRLFKAGALVFARGDRANEMFYVCEGVIEIVELGIKLSAGDVVGEIALFTPLNARTATVRCLTNCVLYSLSAEMVRQMYYQNPSFGFSVIRIVCGRLVENLARYAEPQDREASPSEARAPAELSQGAVRLGRSVTAEAPASELG